MANVVAQCKAEPAHLRPGGARHHRVRRGGRRGHARPAADYWIGLQSALAGQEDYVIVNIGNEPYGNTDYASWTAATKAAIQKLRDAGFEHTIMVDAPNWGQDWQFIMRDNAASVFAADPHAQHRSSPSTCTASSTPPPRSPTTWTAS